MPLSGRPAEWASEAAATPDALLDPASVTVVRHLLSTATSRKPQAALLEALKGRVVQLLADTQGATMVEMLVQYGTVRSVAAVCDALIGSVGETPMSRGEAKVLAALAKRVDEGRGSRVALFTKFMGSLTPAVVADSHEHRLVVAAIAGDEHFGATAAKLVQAAPMKKWLAQSLTDKRTDKEAVEFVTTVLEHAGKGDETASAAISNTVLACIAPLLAPKAEHRPRPEILAALASFGATVTIDVLAGRIAAWSDLAKLLVGLQAKAIATVLLRASADAALKLTASVLAAVPPEQLVARGVGPAKIALAMRERGLLSTDSNSTVSYTLDTAEDAASRLAKSCGIASREAANRELQRLAAGGMLAGGARRPKIAVVEEDDEQDATTRPASAKKLRRK
jgi:hypothetical protein